MVSSILQRTLNFQSQEIAKPDTLHTLYLLQHLIKLIELLHFVGRATVFDLLRFCLHTLAFRDQTKHIGPLVSGRVKK